MSDALVVLGGGGSSAGGASTPPPVPSPTAPVVPDVLTDLRAFLQRHEARSTLVGISAIRALLLAELVGEVKAIEKNIKKYVDYNVPCPPAGDKSSAIITPAPKPGVLPGGESPSADPAAHPEASGTRAAAAGTPSPFISDLGEMLKPLVKMPVEQLSATVDSQGKAIEKGATGITELQTAKSANDARLQALEVHYQRLDAAHRGLSDRVIEMAFKLGDPEDAIEALVEAVVEEGEETGEPVRTTQARPMRQARGSVRKAQVRKKK